MPLLTVELAGTCRSFSFEAGRSVKDILDGTDVRVRSGCPGLGTCGLCRIRVVEGEHGVPTLHEQILLTADERGLGTRLGCQVFPPGDLRIEVLALAQRSPWRSLLDEPRLNLGPEDLAEFPAGALGVAVDLGTTHISLALYDLAGGRLLAGRHGQNPQADLGADVISRLQAAKGDPDQAHAMSQLVLQAVAEGLFDIASREGIDLKRVSRIALVGNTPMLALLAERNYEQLLHPSQWDLSLDCRPADPGAWAAPLRIDPAARIEVLPPLAGFVGSDLLAGVAITRLTRDGVGALFIDFGTNSEIALWDGGTLRVTSAAGGPAFESGISCGMPAEPGAVHQVGPDFQVSVLVGQEPQGLCGSGLVDLVANLLRTGLLNARGQFSPAVSPEGFPMVLGKGGLILTRRDVDLLQRAKAGVGAGVRVLMNQAGMAGRDLGRVCVGGIFGRFLDVANAQAIGLLPVTPADRVELCGNTALAGCAEALLSPAARDRLDAIRDRAKLINMANCPEFDDCFLENLFLRPLGGT